MVFRDFYHEMAMRTRPRERRSVADKMQAQNYGVTILFAARGDDSQLHVVEQVRYAILRGL